MNGVKFYWCSYCLMKLYRWSSTLVWPHESLESCETYMHCSHTLSFSLKRQKEFSCCLVWWKESLEFYKTWCVHREISKLHSCIVRFVGFPLIGCWVNCAIFSQFSKKSSSLPNPKVQIDLFLLWVLITYGPGIYMPNMGINCCSFRKAHVFHSLHV